MSVLSLENFKFGLDARRSELTSQPGVLQVCENAFINQGGEVEKRKAIRPGYVLVGRYRSNLMVNKGLVVFDNVVVPLGWNAWVPGATSQNFDTATYPPRIYMRLVSPGGGILLDVIHACSYAGIPWVIADFADGRYAFYDGVVIPDSYIGAVRGDGVYTTPGNFGTKFGNLVSEFISRWGPTYYTNTFDYSGGNCRFVFTAPPGTTVTNISVSAAGTAVVSYPIAGSVQVLIGGTWADGDTYALTIVIDGVTYTVGGGNLLPTKMSFCYTFNRRVYVLCGTRFVMSALNRPTIFNDPNAAGNGFVDVSSTLGVDEDLVSMSHYQGKLAFGSRQNIQIWQPDANPASFQLLQTLENTGPLAKLCMYPLGDLDVFYLADSGVRSLRVKDISSNAYVVDSGAAINDLISDLFITCTEAEKAAACMMIEPRQNRLFLFIPNAASGDKFYVLSYFPTVKIVAWSTFLPTYQDGSAVQQSVKIVQFFLSKGVVYFIGLDSAHSYTGPGGNKTMTSLSGVGTGAIFAMVTSGGQISSGTLNGVIQTIVNGGTGYAVNDVLTPQDPTGTGSLVRVTSVSAGVITGALCIAFGGYWIFAYDGTPTGPITAAGYDNAQVTVELPWLDIRKPANIKQSLAVDYEMTGSWSLKGSMDYRTGISTLKALVAATAVPTPDKGTLPFSAQGTHIKLQGKTTTASQAMLSALMWHYNDMGEKR